MRDEEWKKEALTLGGQSFVDKISDMADSIHMLAKNLEAHGSRISDAEQDIKKLYSAYPSMDVDGHRRYHELIIENTEEKRRLRYAIKEKTYAGLVWAAIVGLALYCWTEALEFIKAAGQR